MLVERLERSGNGPPAVGPARTLRTNAHKKAGALNQALDSLLPELRDDDSVLVMDAGSILAPGFVSEARRRL
jgi:cellulose synthase/poly-beta-1,6-N-acetylglucosamine synthase-like glycosyltransferase